jgi:hypothetical protein
MSLHIIDEKAPQVSEGTGSPPARSQVYDDNVVHVAEKYRGTTTDEADMAVLGKKQVLRVSSDSSPIWRDGLQPIAGLESGLNDSIRLDLHMQLGRYTHVCQLALMEGSLV